MDLWDEFQKLVNGIPDWWNGLSDRMNSPHDDPWDAVLDTLDIDDEARKHAIADISGVPIIGDVFKTLDRNQQITDYMKNTGLTWNDVKYPALMNTGSTYMINAARQGTNFVSDNVKKLYQKH